MERKPISAMFDTYEAATRCVTRLKAAGIPESDISIVGGDTAMRAPDGTIRDDAAVDASDATETNAGSGTAVGAAIGGGAGLLAGLGILAVPGVGPVVAAGWLATTLLGAIAGGAAGGIIGGLVDAGMPEEEAHTYAEGIRRGGTLVTVNTDSARIGEVTTLLDQEGAIDMNQRAGTWRNEGWSGRYEPPPTSATTAGMAGAATGAMAGSSSGSVPLTDERPVASSDTTSEAARQDPVPIIEDQVEIEIVRAEVHPVEQSTAEADLARQDQGSNPLATSDQPVEEQPERRLDDVSLQQGVEQPSEDTVKRTDVEIEDERRKQQEQETKRSG